MSHRAVVTPPFLATFLGALVLSGGAALLQLGADQRSVLPWVVAAFGLYLLVVVITGTVHVPRNDAIKAAGAPDRIGDLPAVRAAFDETRWMAWNWVRAVASTAAFAGLTWALVLHGRATV